jgi:hypothetical protein
VGTFTNTLNFYSSIPGPNSNGSGDPIALSLTYSIGGLSYTGTLDGLFVENGWTQSITSNQFYANDYILFNKDSLVNGIDVAPLGTSGYFLETSASNSLIAKGTAINVTITPSNPTTPEPGTWGVMALGLLAVGGYSFRRGSKANFLGSAHV